MLSNSKVFSIIGEEKFNELVEVFYSKIEKDDLLRGMFPEDLSLGKKLQILFLIQRFGGPNEYQRLRGPAHLRKRHFLFKIGLEERNRWFNLMIESLDEIGIDSDHQVRPEMEEYFKATATKMINQNVFAVNIPKKE